MSAIYTYGQWIDIVDRGTSGDQVMDILASWKVNAYKLLEDNHKLESRIAELEAENNRLAELLHNELSSVEIATDLGNKRWTALNKIYEDGEKHNTNWCKRIAQEGLGIKNA